MGRTEAQALEQPTRSNYPHCLSGDVIQTDWSPKREYVNQAGTSPAEN
jgi:hypothetical protein